MLIFFDAILVYSPHEKFKGRKMLNYSVFKKDKTAVVKASGKICRAAVLSSGNFVRIQTAENR